MFKRILFLSVVLSTTLVAHSQIKSYNDSQWKAEQSESLQEEADMDTEAETFHEYGLCPIVVLNNDGLNCAVDNE